ncbi:MAG: glycosyltransferase [Thermoleophilia bacterium]|nr:glycosyltransferase [Thermoleophilia bacterium]MDH5281058.1 glycosyltransferase [Thermoleophilia bacterium]
MISIIVPRYSYPRALGLGLRSLLEQREHDFEVIVTEGGRGRDTLEVVDSWRARPGDRLAHVYQDDTGFPLSRARNRGALASRGEYLAFLHGDCVPRRRFVDALRKAATPAASRRPTASRCHAG